MKRAFITGGSGHVGANLTRRLINQGWRVRCLVHNDTRALEGLDVDCVHGDLLDEDFLSQQMQDCYAVFHACLLYTSPSPRDRTRSRMPSSA